MSSRTDKTTELAAERQQPATAAEQAAAGGRYAEWARDVPRSCDCPHQWDPRAARYRRVAPMPGCPWHTQGRPLPEGPRP